MNLLEEILFKLAAISFVTAFLVLSGRY